MRYGVGLLILILIGAGDYTADLAEGMAKEFYEDVGAATVEGSRHWIAEEQPGGFVEKILAFVGR